jgi:hypothetical protein
MTMHERPPGVTGSSDQSQAAAGEMRQDSQQTDPADLSTGSADPAGQSSVASQAFGAERNEPTPSGAPVGADPGREAPSVSADDSSAQHQSSTEDMLFAEDELADLRARWAGVQAAFVDDPKDCVQKADVLVSDLVEQLTSGFAHARSRLEEQWARGERASTEDLRVALMHYREFFERLLAV